MAAETLGGRRVHGINRHVTYTALFKISVWPTGGGGGGGGQVVGAGIILGHILTGI